MEKVISSFALGIRKYFELALASPSWHCCWRVRLRVQERWQWNSGPISIKLKSRTPIDLSQSKVRTKASHVTYFSVVTILIFRHGRMVSSIRCTAPRVLRDVDTNFKRWIISCTLWFLYLKKKCRMLRGIIMCPWFTPFIILFWRGCIWQIATTGISN